MIKIYEEDCIQGMLEIKEKTIDVVVTSPPYNIGIKYKTYKDKRNFEDYLWWLCKVSNGIKSVLKDNGSFFLNLGDRAKEPLRSLSIVTEICSRSGWKCQNVIHWVKSITIGDNSIGHFKPINSERLINNCHEYIFHLTKEGNVKLKRLAIGVPYKDKSNIKRWKGKKDLRCRGNCWFIPYETVQREKRHPAAFPVELPETCIKLHGGRKKGMKVMDPFLGSGSTLLACKKLGVDGIGFEIDPYYVKLSRGRLDEK